MKVNEIFYSLQGEGRYSGIPTTFIRTTGCNLRCTYCDTTYAYEKEVEMNIPSIIKKIKLNTTKYICITGGEPLLQQDINELINELLQRKYEICVETNGSLLLTTLDNFSKVCISLDVKCPSSNMHEKTKLENLNYISSKDQIKFIIKNKIDYEYAKKIISSFSPHCPVFFQPVWGSDPKKLAQQILNDNLPVHLGLQLHKLLWGSQRGV